MSKYKGFNQERKLGEYTIYLPDPPNLSEIGNKDLSQSKQKFYPISLPKDIMLWDKKSREDFEDNEWNKRRNGYWFWNNGNLEYITGTNYLYTNWWKIDIGLPSFVDSDRDWFYVWKHVKENPKARGFLTIARRREGKTYRATCVVYDEVSQTPNSLGGIQSKNNPDAEKVFKKLILSWQKLPYFFKPVDVGDSSPKTRLEFSQPSRRNTKVQQKEYGLVLDSSIDYENAKEEAYDGTKQLINFQDEVGKVVEANVNERLKIVKECVMDGSDIVGKIIATTTVEEMERKGGKNCKLMWDGADPNRLLPNGETQNGMLRYFNPAYYGYRGKDNNGIPFVDEYGYSDQERAKEYIKSKRDALKERDDVISDRRKYPFTINDCFIQDSKKSVFDTGRIEQQIEYNSTLLDNILIRGNFLWKDGIKDTEVVWNPDANGRWLISWLPPIDKRNKWLMKGGRKYPSNTEDGCFGLDPYDNKLTVDNRKSDAASYGIRKFDPMNPYETGIFISEYVNRPKAPELMWEDMLMQAVFFGWEILVENNKIGTINYFRTRGYYEYLMERPAETMAQNVTLRQMAEAEKGIPMSGEEARLALIHSTESFIINRVGLIEEENKEPYMGKCYFNKLLNNWLEFDFDRKWTEFDSMVGAGLAILGSRKYIPKKVEKRDLTNLFPRYDNSGMTSQIMK